MACDGRICYGLGFGIELAGRFGILGADLSC